MHKVKFETISTNMSADIFTPVSIYLRVRDQFRDAVLLESTDFNSEENSYSFIGINAIAGIEYNNNILEYRLPNDEAKQITLPPNNVVNTIQQFMECFVAKEQAQFPMSVAQSLLGYFSYTAIPLFENITIANNATIPTVRFRFYQYIIAINHFKDDLFIIENVIDSLPSIYNQIETCITKKDVPQFPFISVGTEVTNSTDQQYLLMVEKGIAHCKRGDVFQVVLSRQFEQSFVGDDFNVYRSLRNVNPSPYLFYFDYGNYRLFGSSPEAQLIVQNNTAIMHPIAGTVRRTGNTELDIELTEQLQNDPKENAEHIMLVDLARNDLSKFCNNIAISKLKQVKNYSHLIHLVSEVTGTLQVQNNIVNAFGHTFPAGTLSGAPKHKAMQIIDELEAQSRGYYGGAIGILCLNGTCNMAIMIRTFLSKNNVLHYQAGAGIVAASTAANELQEVNNKIAALQTAVKLATTQYQ